MSSRENLAFKCIMILSYPSEIRQQIKSLHIWIHGWIRFILPDPEKLKIRILFSSTNRQKNIMFGHYNFA